MVLLAPLYHKREEESKAFMRLIIDRETDPGLNLATEEILLRRGGGDTVRLWRNDRAVIVGRNQNTFAEVNVSFAQANGIRVVRRLSGGGAVFHDLGNVNFSFYADAPEEGKMDFRRFLEPIAEILRGMGVPAMPDGRNDLTANGRKLSGNAQCVLPGEDGRKRLLHHGTLLFGADFSSMEGALRPDPEKLSARGIGSIRSRVCNIRDVDGYRGPGDTEGFMEALAAALGGENSFLSAEEKTAAANLARDKYATWEWNFGRSGQFETKKRRRYPFGSVQVYYSAEGGILTAVRITGDFFGSRSKEELENALSGVRLEEDALRERLTDSLVDDCIRGMTSEQLIRQILDHSQTEEF